MCKPPSYPHELFVPRRATSLSPLGRGIQSAELHRNVTPVLIVGSRKLNLPITWQSDRVALPVGRLALGPGVWLERLQFAAVNVRVFWRRMLPIAEPLRGVRFIKENCSSV
jgi:hypothetical protein